MIWKVRKSVLKGTISVPPSKSHTIRALLIATLADGESIIESPLLEGDGKSALDAALGLGAQADIAGSTLRLKGVWPDMSRGPECLYLGNSGTGTSLFTSAAALGSKPRTFDGDQSLRSRPMKPLLEALGRLGARYAIHQKKGDVPFTITGPLKGGETEVVAVNSQFLSSLLLSAPLAEKETVIIVKNLHEKPYVEMTLWWLDRMNISYAVSENFTVFTIPGSQRYKNFRRRIPGDFSSATFGAVAAALTGGPVTLDNIDFTDPQGDKEVFAVLEHMGVAVEKRNDSAVVSRSDTLKGAPIDLNRMPDALPALAVLGCLAEGSTALCNVQQARIKETDRIKVMCEELGRMGALVEEREDGLVVHASRLTGCRVNGHHDHRVVMALCLAGMIAEGETIIETAEAAAVTYPGFADDF